MTDASARVDGWLDAVIARHTAHFTTPEFLKAVRALSARYVETRHSLAGRSPIDTAGKRAAFAGFYAPLHFLTTQAILAALGADTTVARGIVDLGCGTGVVGAAWSLACPDHPDILGIDHHSWVLAEARWNWHTLGVPGRTGRGDLNQPLRALLPRTPARSAEGLGLALGWAVNELPQPRWPTLLEELLRAARDGASILVIEPLARSASPWWDSWAAPVVAQGGRADEWKFEAALPARLATLDEAAGFRRDTLGARTLWIRGA